MIIVIERFFLRPEIADDTSRLIHMLGALMASGPAAPFHIHRSFESEHELVLQYHWDSRESYGRLNARDDRLLSEFCERFCSSAPQATLYDCYPLRVERHGNSGYC